MIEDRGRRGPGVGLHGGDRRGAQPPREALWAAGEPEAEPDGGANDAECHGCQAEGESAIAGGLLGRVATGDAGDLLEVAVGLLELCAVMARARGDQEVGGRHGHAGGPAAARQLAGLVPDLGGDGELERAA